jgi:hypothetical protein
VRTEGATVKLTGDSRPVLAFALRQPYSSMATCGVEITGISDDVEVERQSSQHAVQPVRAEISRLHRIYEPPWAPKFYSRDARYASSELILSNSFGR